MSDIEKLINDVAVNLPTLPERKKNLLDILGINTKETINSQFLAYFLNQNENHDLDSVFFNALKDIIVSKSDGLKPVVDLDLFKGGYQVYTEVTTLNADSDADKQKRIDIGIAGDDWYIIIENKLYHHMANPLLAYWQHVQKEKKTSVGIVLSLWPVEGTELLVNEEIAYINITHEELLKAVIKRFDFSENIDSLHIGYFNEYIKTMRSHYDHQLNQPIMDELINQLSQKREVLRKIEKYKGEAIRSMDEFLIKEFSSKAFEKKGSHYLYTQNEKTVENFCFFITPSKQILEDNTIFISLEVWGELINQAKKNNIQELLREKCEDIGLSSSNSHQSKHYLHLATYSDNEFLKSGQIFSEEIRKILRRFFEDGIVNFVKSNLRF